MRKLLIAALLLGSVQLAAQAPLNVKNGMRSLVNKGFVSKMQLFGMSLLAGAGLALITPQVAVGGEAVFRRVEAEDPAYRQSVVLLRSSNPDAGTEVAFHFIHVGSDADNNAVLIGRELALNSVVAAFLGEGNNVSLYGWDGKIADNLTVNVTEVFEDNTDGTFNAIALTIEGLNLSDTYHSTALDSTFPYDDAVGLELLTYRLFYLSLLTEDEIAADNFPLLWQSCNAAPNAQAGVVDVVFTTCGNPFGGHVALGSIIFHNDVAVAVQSRPTGRRDMRTWLAAGIPQLAVDFANSINGNATPVEAQGKLATTWGALKRGALRDTYNK